MDVIFSDNGDSNINIIIKSTTESLLLIWPLEYIVFGSKSSEDHDIIVNIPESLITKSSHVFTQICNKLDIILYEYLSSKSKAQSELESKAKSELESKSEPESKSESKSILKIKKVNTCLGNWKDGILKWSQKGTISETNNAIINTFEHHLYVQMFKVCPLIKLMIRDEKDKRTKIITALRMITSIFTHTTMEDDDIYKILEKILNIEEIKNLDSNTYNRINIILIKIYDLKKSTYNKLLSSKSLFDDRNIVEIEYNILVKLREQLSKLRRNIVINEYKELYNKSKSSMNKIINVVNNNKDKFDEDFIKCFDDEVYGYTLTLRGIARAVLIAKYVCFQSDFLECIDFTKVNLYNDASDKLKKIAFQLGQTLALLYGYELYEKETISQMYPCLTNILFRKSPTNEDLDNLTKMLHVFTKEIYLHIDRSYTL